MYIYMYTHTHIHTRGVKTRRREEDPRRIAVGARGKKSGCQGSVIQNFRCTLGLSSPLAASHFQLTWKERVCPSSWAAYTRPRRQCKDVLLRLAGSFFLAETSTAALSKAVEEEAAFIRGQGCISFCRCSLSLLRELGYNGDGNNFLPLLLSSVRAGFWARDQQNFRLSPGLRNWLALVVFGFMRASVCHFPSILSEGFECFRRYDCKLERE